MKAKIDLWRGITALALLMAAAASLAAPAAAKPRPVFAPKVGEYSGDSFAEGKTHSAFAQVKSKVSAEIEIPVPAKCTSAENPAPLQTELLFKVPARIKGRSVSFKGNSVDAMKIVGFGVASRVTLNGRFTSDSAFSANVTVQAPAPGLESEVRCSVPATKLKFEFSIAA